MLGVTHGSGFMSGADRQRFRIVVSSPTLNFVLTDRLNALGWDGRAVDVDILVVTDEGDIYPMGVPDPVNDLWETYAGAWIGSSTTSAAALLLDTLPIGSAVTVDNRGFICGRGGDGGNGGVPGVNSGLGGNGGAGGPAIRVDSTNWYPITIVNRGFIGGGGGGGGGGTTYNSGTDRGAGGGPGGGLPAGNSGTTTNRSDYFNGYRRGSFPYGGCGGGLRSEPGSTSLWAQSSAGGNGGAVGEPGMDQAASPASVANPGQGLGGPAGAAIVDPNDQVTLVTPGNVPGTGGIVWGPGTPPDPSNYVWGSFAPVCQVRGPGLPFAYDGDVQVVMAGGELKKMRDLVAGDEVATFTPSYITALVMETLPNIMDEDNFVYNTVPFGVVGDILGSPPDEILGISRGRAVVVNNPPFTLTTVLDRFDIRAIEGTTFTTPLSGALVNWHGRVLCGDPSGTSDWSFTNVDYANKRILFRSRTGVANPDTGALIPPQSTHPLLPAGERRFVKATTGTCSPTSSGTYTVYSPVLGAIEGTAAPGLVIAAAYTASTPAGTEERSMLVLARGNKVMPRPPAPPLTSAWPEWKAGTMFTMADGTTKNVSALVAGDLLRCVSGHPNLHGKFKYSDFYTPGFYGGPPIPLTPARWKRSQTTVTTSTVRVKRCIPARVITSRNPGMGSLPPMWPLTSQNSDELFFNRDWLLFITMRGGSGPAGIFTAGPEFNVETVGLTLDSFPGNTWYSGGVLGGGPGGQNVAILRHRPADPYRPQFTNTTSNSSYCLALTTAQDPDAAGQTYYLEIEPTGPTSCAVIIANGYYVVNVESGYFNNWSFPIS